MSFTIAHFSDLHESAPLQDWRGLFDKRIAGGLNSYFTRHFDRRKIRHAVTEILESKPDVLVFSGDATTCSQPKEFELALEDLRPLIDSGIPIIYSPGNHDIYVKRTECCTALEHFIKILTHDRQSLKTFPYAVDYGPVRFIAINAAYPANIVLSCGRLSQDSADFVENECRNKTKPIVLISHFPVMNLEQGIGSLRRRMYGAGDLRKNPPDLILCGHIHKAYRLPKENDCGSIGKYGVFTLITFENGTFTLESRS